MKKVVLSGMIGNALEWYDFALYGYFAAIIGKQFFPSGDPYVSLLATYGAFAAGFLMRPFGAVLFGMIGDKYGRKVSLALAILMMAVPTACIGLLPGYAQIGIWAPILLTLIRLCQGLSLGGEFSGAITFIVEHSKDHHRGLAGSTTVLSLVAGMLMGSGVATLTTSLCSPEALEDWGWRVPFLFGLVVGLIGFYIRHHTEESPKYTATQESSALSQTPVRDAFRYHRREMLQAIGMYLSVTVPFYVSTIFMITYYAQVLGNPLKDSLLINTCVMFLLMAVVTLSGWLSDRIGRRRIMMIAAVGYLLLAYPLFWLSDQGSFALALLAQLAFAVVHGFYIGPVPAVLVELFPTRLRYTGMAIAYNLAAAIFGGTAPMVATWLIRTTENNYVVAYYIMICAVISFVTLYFYKDRYREDLR